MAIDDIRINGHQIGWPSVIFKVDGEGFTGFTDLSYDDKLESGFAWGAGKSHAPRGRSPGKYTPGVLKLTGWKGAIQQLRAFIAAKAPNGKSYGKVIFQISLQYIEEGDTSVTVLFEDVKWASNTSGDSESPDPLKEDIELQPMRIKRNGLTLYDSSQEV